MGEEIDWGDIEVEPTQKSTGIFTDIFFVVFEPLLGNRWCGGMAKWLTCQTSNLRIACHMDSNPSGASHCILEQETLHSLLSWFQKRI